MDLYSLMSIILTLAVAIAYLNSRFFKLQTTTAIFTGSLLLSALLIIIGQFGFYGFEKHIDIIFNQINFHALLMNGMLSFLLFAGALTVDINDLRKHKWEIATLASLSTVVSTLLISSLSYYLLQLLGNPISFIYCLLFGALISPTDPIAVLAVFKKLNAPRGLDVCVAGESLFNDGVGIVMFITIYHLVFQGDAVTFHSVSTLFLQQAVGGILYGVALGILAYQLMKSLHDSKTEILITLALVTGGYAFANIINVSGPLAMVTAGIFIGNHGRDFNMSNRSRKTLDEFWELIDEILNAVLFLLIGLELLAVKIDSLTLLAGAAAIPMVLIVRFITVGIPMTFFKLKRQYSPHTIHIMTWGGLRGGLAVALALSLPKGSEREIILTMTYAVVMFANIVQALTIKPLVELSKK